MDELLTYVMTYFSHRMTADEKLAESHLSAIEPLYLCRLLPDGRWEEDRTRQAPNSLKELLRGAPKKSEDPEILFLARGGSEAFRERTAQRILLQHRNEIFVNTCPSCGALPRTPRARQCRVCGHGWH
jgi:hypothetical protein